MITAALRSKQQSTVITQVLRLFRYNVDTSSLSFLLSSDSPRRAGSDGSMSASGSAGPGIDPPRGSKFSFENFQPRG